jgi:hypothetical protein
MISVLFAFPLFEMFLTFLAVQDLDWFLLLKYLRLLYKVKFNLFPEKYFSVGQVQIVQRDFTAAQATATFAMVLILKFATLSVVK